MTAGELLDFVKDPQKYTDRLDESRALQARAAEAEARIAAIAERESTAQAREAAAEAREKAAAEAQAKADRFTGG